MNANRDEDILLRVWYAERGCNAVVTDAAFSTVKNIAKGNHLDGFNPANVRSDVFAAFAQACVVPKPRKHKAQTEITVDDMLRALGELQ